jgi:hypothetical protein
MANEDDLITETSREQKKLTEVVGGLYKLAHERLLGDEKIELRRQEHVAFLERGLEYMGPGYAVSISDLWGAAVPSYAGVSILLLGVSHVVPCVSRCLQ